MANKILANISVSRAHPHVSRSIRVVGALGTLIANTANGSLELIQKNPHPKDDTDFLRVTTEAVEKVDALQAETDAFVSSLLRGIPRAVTGQDGLKAMRLIADIEKHISK
jgi:predicted dehydrogenase